MPHGAFKRLLAGTLGSELPLGGGNHGMEVLESGPRLPEARGVAVVAQAIAPQVSGSRIV